MAYMDQAKKKAIEPKVKEVLAKYGMKGRLSVRHHSTLVLNITEGKLDIFSNFNRVAGALPRAEHNPFVPVTTNLNVNHHWCHEHFDGNVKDFMMSIKAAMMDGNHDRSDIMTDYFDVGFYVDINVGAWDKPYTLVV